MVTDGGQVPGISTVVGGGDAGGGIVVFQSVTTQPGHPASGSSGMFNPNVLFRC